MERPQTQKSSPETGDGGKAGTGFSIYGYFDYRECLRCHFLHRKALNRRFSYRVFAAKAGYKNPGLYIMLVKGKLNLTRNKLAMFIKGMELHPREAEYFTLMVQFTHASTPEAKQHWFEKMLPLMPPSSRILTRDQAEYYRKWYHVAVREALSVLDVGEDTSVLADFLQPPITSRQAAASLKLLHSLGLILRDGGGCWRATDAILVSTPGLGPLLIHPFQESLIDMAKAALKRYPREKRHVSCFTFSISENGNNRLRLMMEKFLHELADLVRSDQGIDRVCQFNLQLFPLSGEKK
ncbi:MAG: TIGR02147 family protein [Fibrobacteria bacterium]